MLEKLLNLVRSAQVGSIAINGKGDATTVKAMQKFFGVTQDGVIGGQNASQQKYRPALTAVKNGKGGSRTVTALQKWCGLSGPDGVWGKNTSAGLQRKLKSLGYLASNESIDGICGQKTMKAFQECLNNNGKAKPSPQPTPTPTPTPTPSKKPYAGPYPTDAEIKAASNLGIRKNMCTWAKGIADTKSYHYKNWTPGDKKTQQCPVCYNLTGKYKGWNCIGYAFACWHHGGSLPSKCTCSVVSNEVAESMLKGTEANALSLARKRIGLNDLQVIRNNKKAIAVSSLQKGDIIMYFNGNTYSHTLLYIGNSKVSDSSSGNTNKLVSYGKKLDSSRCKVAIRYTGGRNYLSKNDEGAAVTKIQNYLDWYFDGAFFKECGKADGVYGANTEKWVKKMQTDFFGVKEADGTIGAKTIAKMKTVQK